MHAKKLSKKQAALIVGGFSALCVAGVAGWFFMNKDAPAPRPRPVMAKKAQPTGAPGEVLLPPSGTRRADA